MVKGLTTGPIKVRDLRVALFYGMRIAMRQVL